MVSDDRLSAIETRIYSMLEDFQDLEAHWKPISHFDFAETDKSIYSDIAENIRDFISHEERFAYATEQDGYIEKAWGGVENYTTIRDLSEHKTHWMTDLFASDVTNRTTGPEREDFIEGLAKGTGYNELERARFYTETLEGVMRYKSSVMEAVADYFETQFNDENLAAAQDSDTKDMVDDYVADPRQFNREAEDRDRDELDYEVDNLLEAHGRAIENMLSDRQIPDDTIHHVLQEVYNEIEVEADDHFFKTGEAIGMKLMAERLREKVSGYDMNADALEQIQQSFVTLKQGIQNMVGRELASPAATKFTDGA